MKQTFKLTKRSLAAAFPMPRFLTFKICPFNFNAPAVNNCGPRTIRQANRPSALNAAPKSKSLLRLPRWTLQSRYPKRVHPKRRYPQTLKLKRLLRERQTSSQSTTPNDAANADESLTSAAFAPRANMHPLTVAASTATSAPSKFARLAFISGCRTRSLRACRRCWFRR